MSVFSGDCPPTLFTMHRAGRVGKHGAGDVTKEKPREASSATVPDDDAVGVIGDGRFDQLCGCVALTANCDRLHARA